MNLKSGGLVLWRGLRPIPVLLAAALIGLSMAVLLWAMLNPLLELLAGALTWIVDKLRQWFTELPDQPDVKSYKNIGIGVGAFGVLVVLSTLKDTHQSLTALALKWTRADRSTLSLDSRNDTCFFVGDRWAPRCPGRRTVTFVLPKNSSTDDALFGS